MRHDVVSYENAALFLRQADGRLAALIDVYQPRDVTQQTPLQALIGYILGQQLSKRAADSIRSRLMDLREGGIQNAAQLSAITDAQFKAAGVSQRKAEFLRDLAEQVGSGKVELDRISELPDQAIYEQLLGVKGIGAWTVEMFLIFFLQRPDVFPTRDVAILASMRTVYDLPADSLLDSFIEISDRWRPYRSFACWYLYSHLDEMRLRASRSKTAPTVAA
jgi:DNA-3-methyladenine glycosylase II